jgi:hypothetical protein
VKLPIIVSALFVLAALHLFIFPTLSAAPSDPCDGYGDCLSSPLAYLRANPDNSLYLGDSFEISLGISYGPNTVSSHTTWAYDTAAFSANATSTQAEFRTLVNASSTYTVAASVTFTVVICTTSNGVTTCVTYHAALTVQQTVQTRGFDLQLTTKMANATDSQGLLLRNPDGSFYHDDEFFVNYTYGFLFMQQRPDIKIVVEPQFAPSFVKLTAYQNSSSAGYFLFTVANSTGTSKITVTANAFNYRGTHLGSKTQDQPFAVVNYIPYFTYFTYMEYNSRNTSAYERPFVTLVRYDGNNPGYSYGGDANTAPITAVNDTRQRALINSFNFTTVAWGVKANLTSGDISQDLSFWNQTSTNVGTRTTNGTYPVLTFAQRVVKFYFTSDVGKIQVYTEQGLEYFNVTELAVSRDFAGGNYALFNTSYLYQPVYYSGYLTVLTYGPSGLDLSTSVNMTLVTLDPLNPHLLASLNMTFGQYPTVVHVFENDLYPAYSTVMNLKPVSSSGGKWVFLLNDTNLATLNETQMPTLNISVQGKSGSYSYSVPVAFSSFVINRTLVPQLPFADAKGYYLDQERQLIAMPLNYSFTSPSPFVAWDYGLGTTPSFVSPVSYEPGNLSKMYGFLFGGNSTIYANLDGGGGSLVNIQRQQTNFQAFAMIGPQTGGATSLWVKDPNGSLIVNETLTPNTEPPSPLGYFGFHSLSFPMSVNGTYQFGIANSWGVSSVFQTYDNNVQLPPPPNEQYFLMTFFGFLVVGLYFLGKIARRRRPGGLVFPQALLRRRDLSLFGTYPCCNSDLRMDYSVTLTRR